MANLTLFNVPDFAPALIADPTEQEINDWANTLSVVIAALDNIITFFGLQIPVIPIVQGVAAGAGLAARLAHVQNITIQRTQIILFQGQVFTAANNLVGARTRPTIKVQRPTFDGKTENTRGFTAAVSTYRHLRGQDFPDDETFIAWALGCMEGPQVNPWRNSLLLRRTQPLLPLMLTDWDEFLVEFNGKFLDPNEIENAGRNLMNLRQVRSAREFAQEFDRLAEMAGQTGQGFLQDQFRRSLKQSVQEKLLRQNFPTLQALQVAAIKWDDTLFQFKRQQRASEPKRPPPRPQPKQSANGTPMDLDFARLSPEETEKRKKAGLCFRCGKPRHMGRNCPSNKKQATYPQKESYLKIAAMERPLSPISEDTYVEDIDQGKNFQED